MAIQLRRLMELGPELGGKGKDGGRRTIGRRAKSDPDFPPITRINNRCYIDAAAWEEYKNLVFRRGLETRPAKTAAASGDLEAR